ncbi:MAG: Ribosomal RNA small subunit methyltransferase H [Candidatus Woesebacteria bacterium GW2011_GWB1_38_5b]|uniref:Ribosomal RNA small subunit methyltransferase H n=1 Tax=Candidatus Woesebacteria bacterium GW2011_GWB1_38_5b TaxID=1618569 RepID=A0A0G0NEX2_9BACT|nr:MAG: Ribosomal RNA small subunit methyltransferase H [Candidatus Woesebacteria bacterium GW2011_GWB1_38_5b]
MIHEPVLVREVLENLDFAHSKTVKIIDATVGTGGHSEYFCKAGAQILGIDADLDMLEIAKKRLEVACPGHFRLVRGNFAQIDQIAKDNNFGQVDAILFDLGISSVHYSDIQRGFSFENPDEPLDMRLDPSFQNVTAADLLNALDETKLKSLFEIIFDPGLARIVAKKVIKLRSQKAFEKVKDATVITYQKAKLFLALRIAVNTELENIPVSLTKAWGLLKIGGRLLVISFHSMEDRIVKRALLDLVEAKTAKLITKKPIMPGLDELNKNPRARSAKLWILEK